MYVYNQQKMSTTSDSEATSTQKTTNVSSNNAGKNKVTNPRFANAQACSPGSIEKQPQNFQDMCNEEIAIDNSNEMFCKNIKDATVKDRCYWHLHDCSKVTGAQYLSICAQTK